HLANDFLPGLRASGDVRQRESVERQAASPRALVVTADAVLIDQRAVGRALGRDLRRALPRDLGRALTLAGGGSQHDDPRDEAEPDAPDHPRPFRPAKPWRRRDLGVEIVYQSPPSPKALARPRREGYCAEAGEQLEVSVRIEVTLTRSSLPAFVRKPFATTFWSFHPAGAP